MKEREKDKEKEIRWKKGKAQLYGLLMALPVMIGLLFLMAEPLDDHPQWFGIFLLSKVIGFTLGYIGVRLDRYFRKHVEYYDDVF